MELLDFMMPPFARIQWASKDIKEKYEPMFNLAKTVYGRLEKETVKHGLRHVTTEHVSPYDFDVRQQEFAKNGMVFLPLQKVGHYTGFSNYHPPVEEGKPWHYYGVLADSIEHAEQFAHATEIGDHTTIGKLLGFPECCIDMFNTKWKEGYVDPVWQQAEKTDQKYVSKKEDKLIRLKDLPWEANTMLRTFNVGPIFHVKDSFDCPHTIQKAKDWVKLAKDLNMEGLKEMEMFLRMPVEWDALKGIAYIRTPLFKASINSVTCTERHRVQLEGTYFPSDSPKGLGFPWSEAFVTVARNGNKLDHE
jgi:hypothetical protein